MVIRSTDRMILNCNRGTNLTRHRFFVFSHDRLNSGIHTSATSFRIRVVFAVSSHFKDRLILISWTWSIRLDPTSLLLLFIQERDDETTQFTSNHAGAQRVYAD